MDNRHLYRGKRLDNGEWETGTLAIERMHTSEEKHFIVDKMTGYHSPIDPATAGQCTGLTAAKSYRGAEPEDRLIFKGDITELVLPDGKVRRFEVDIRTVMRNVVSHPDFDDTTAKVAITGIVFLWNCCGTKHELFPCVDENGVADTNKMSIIGNIHDHPELLEVDGE